MSRHNEHKTLFGCPEAVDPGDAKTINVDGYPYSVGLISAAAETRTLARPTRTNALAYLYVKTYVGDITLTVTGGYNVDGDTTFTFTAAGQYLVLIGCFDGTNYFWRELSNYSTANLTATEAAWLDGVTAGTTAPSKAFVAGSSGQLTMAAATTPTAVGTTPGTAAPTELTVTGGVGGGTTIATTGTGGVGGGFSITAGAGGAASAAATAATGGAGGAWATTTGAGGAEAVATVTATGGAGGAWTVTSGAGGAVSAAVSGTATGGTSGALTVASGTGGAVTATTGTNVGGASGAVSFVSGTGGAASGGSGNTGGASGTLTVGTGTGGSGTTGGASGDLILVTGAPGAGGSPATGVISFKPGTSTERWRMTTAGALASGAATPTNTNLLGVVTGVGFSTADALANIISAATHGAGSTATLIGNATITVSSDSRIKKDVVAWSGKALDAISRAPQLVEYTYDIPGCGGDLAEPGDENARKYGPNARGRYLGFIAQETVEWAPWVVNAGAGKDCKKCRAGQKCEEHPIPWTVEYEHLVPLLVKAVQELTAKVARLEASRS